MKSNAHALSADQILSIPSSDLQRERTVRVVVRSRICRHCKRRIPLLRSLLFKAAFCNRTHEREYLNDIETLALERLAISAKRLKLVGPQADKPLVEPPQ